MRLIYLFFIFLLAASCDKAICRETDEELPGHKNAVVKWSGSPASDGLEWVLHVDGGKMEKPLNLPAQYETDGLQVSVSFEPTNEKYPCFCAGGSINMIRILSIKKR